MRRELKIQLFHKFYEEPLDYTHLTLEKGDMYTYFLDEKHPDELEKLTKDNFPIHLSDVPAGLVDEYKAYLREKLLEWGFAAEDDFDANGDYTDMFMDYTIENFWEEISCNEHMQKAHDELMKVDETIDALENVYNSLQKVLWNWHDLDMNNLTATKIYPFELSLDEFLSGKFDDWINATVAELLGDLDTVAEIVSEY